MVAAPRDGTPFVALSDVNGRLRAELSASDTIGLRFLDEKGKVAAGFFESAGDAYIAILKGDRIKWTAP